MFLKPATFYPSLITIISILVLLDVLGTMSIDLLIVAKFVGLVMIIRRLRISCDFVEMLNNL